MSSNEGVPELRPVKFLHPTQAIYTNRSQPKSMQPEHNEAGDSKAASTPDFQNLPENVQYRWTSRDNRKGRHRLVVPRNAPKNSATPPPTTTTKAILRGIWRMMTYYPYWDISYLAAVSFTLGSVVWCINGFFSLLPLYDPGSHFSGESLYGGGVTAFIGVNIFEIGGIFFLLEALNENHERCFGWAVERWYEGRNKSDDEDDSENDVVKVSPATDSCSHHHQRRLRMKLPDAIPLHTKTTSKPKSPNRWTWWPSMKALRTQYFHSIGFIASFMLFWSATIFWLAGLTALPGITNVMTTAETTVFYWVPQIVGGLGFTVSGWMFMVETQKNWWLPAPLHLGWHVGFWNMIGGLGFLLCPIFGLVTAPWGQYQASISTFWGSWAFLIGSVVQWYESLEKYPVVVGKE